MNYYIGTVYVAYMTPDIGTVYVAYMSQYIGTVYAAYMSCLHEFFTACDLLGLLIENLQFLHE